MDFKQLAAQYKNELFENVLPFWLHRSQDFEQGGYYTYLNRRGEVFDTDKFVWLQGREVWLFSMLYNKVEKQKEQMPKKISDRIPWAKERSEEHNAQIKKNKAKYRGMEL